MPLATFPSPIPGQCNETADLRDLDTDKVLAVPAAAAASAPPEHQDLDPLPFPFDEPDGLELVEAPRPPCSPSGPPRKGQPPPPRKDFWGEDPLRLSVKIFDESFLLLESDHRKPDPPHLLDG